MQDKELLHSALLDEHQPILNQPLRPSTETPAAEPLQQNNDNLNRLKSEVFGSCGIFLIILEKQPLKSVKVLT